MGTSNSRSDDSGPTQRLMVREQQEVQARDNYNRLAACYDCWSSWEKPYLDHALSLVDLEITTNETVLEIGCGTGYCLEKICLAGNSVVGIDISEKMVEKTINRLQSSVSNPEQYEVLCASATKLPFDVHKFDCVLVCFTLELFPVDTITAVLTEVERVLKPGGRLVAVSMSSDETVGCCCGCPMQCYKCSHACCPTVVDCRPIGLLSFCSKSDGLTPVSVQVLPFYGLAVESVVCKRIANKSKAAVS